MDNNWDINKLQSYINNQVEENLSLDYKAGDALQKTDGKKKEISKDISAMANAAGGIIIYGIKEFDDTAKKHLPEKISPVNRTEISKEWLEQVINSNIQPKINGIIITPVTVNDEDNTVVYIVEIPQSTTAHQAGDKKYYKRYNFESAAMEDYEIRDIMSRLKNPEVTLEFVIEKTKEFIKDAITGQPRFQLFPGKDKESEGWFEYSLKISIRNNGKIFANYVNYYLALPAVIIHNDEDHLQESEKYKEYKEFYGENTIRDVVDIQRIVATSIKKYGPSRFDPVLPGMRSRFETIRLKNGLEDFNYEIFWTIYADNAEPLKGTIKLSEIIVRQS